MKYILKQNKSDDDMAEVYAHSGKYEYLAFVLHQDMLTDELRMALDEGEIEIDIVIKGDNNE